MSDEYRILVLCDDPRRIDALTEVSANEGYQVVPCRTIAESMDWLESRDHVDVIVADVYLENESIFEFLRAVKTNPKHSWVQFIMLLADPTELGGLFSQTVEVAAKKLGADKYVVMPEFSRERLVKEIKASLPARPPQHVQDPVRDKLGLGRPLKDMPESVTDAQRPREN